MARQDVTPARAGVNMAGFDFERRSLGVRDPLYARALHVTDGARSLSIVSVDVIGLFRDFVELVRADLARSGELLLVAATHNHEGPDTLGYWGKGVFGSIPIRSGVPPRYLGELRAKIVRAVLAARADAEPVVQRQGVARVPGWLTENVRQPGHKDDELPWLRFDRPDGRPKAYLLSFGCHPEVLWADNRRISADFPGELCARIEAETGAMPLFFAGALGGMVTPAIEPSASLADREAFLVAMGDVLCRAVRQSERASEAPPEPASLAFASHPITVRLANPRFLALRALGVLERAGSPLSVRTETSLVGLGRARLFGVPGELLPTMGQRVRARLAGAPVVLTLGLCCDELGYILAPEHFEDATAYRFEKTLSAGRRLSEAVLGSLRPLEAAVRGA